MDLNLDMICERLPSHISMERFGSRHRKPGLRLPLLFAPACEPKKNILYIANSRQLPLTPPAPGLSVICCGNRPPDSWMSKGCQLVWIPDTDDLPALLCEVSRIFDRFNHWEQIILKDMAQPAIFDIGRILTTIATVLENPVNVTNDALVSLFETRLYDRRDADGFDIEIRQPNRMVGPYENIKEIYAQESVIRGLFFSSGTNGDKRCYCRNLFLYERFVGCIYMQELHRPFRTSDMCLADYLFGLFETVFGRYIRNAPSLEPAEVGALKALIAGTGLNERQRAQLLLPEGVQWTCFVLRHRENVGYLPLDSMCTTLNVVLHGTAISVTNGDVILGLLRVTKQWRTDENLIYLSRFISDMGYLAGISTPYADAADTLEYLTLAKFALLAGSRRSEQEFTFYFGDYQLEYLITRYTGDLPARILYPEGLLRLIRHDAASPISYVDTLRTFLTYGMNISRTAGALFIHRSSLINRLEKIKKCLEMDLSDADDRLYLELCLYLMGQRTDR